MNQFIIKLPENTLFDGFSDKAKEVIAHLKGQFPDGTLVGSKAVDGYELKLVMCNISLADFQSALTDGYPMIDDDGSQSMVDLGLDFEILAAEGVKISQDEILPFMLDKLIFEGSEVVDYKPVTDLTGILQTYSGRIWTY